MKKIFELSYKDNQNVSALEIMEKNVKALEELCRQANKEVALVVLHSPEKFDKPKNVYELSAILAEDMVKKYNENNIIIREL